MRLHIVGLPHTQTTSRFLSCAYTQKVIKFCRMMWHAHEVILYSGDENDAPCATHVPLFTEAEREMFWSNGFDTVTSPLRWDPTEPYWRRLNNRAAAAILDHAEPHDLLLLTAGWAHKPIADNVPLMAVEWAVGYEGIFAPYCAFESNAWMHHVYGRQGWATGRFYDAVIPNFFDPAEFRLTPKDDYLLYVGRLVQRKGPQVAAQIAERVGMNLIVAGPGCASHEPGRIVMADGGEIVGPVEYIGELDRDRRASWMASARVLLAPTLYLEPFGGVAIEAMLSGTPVVTTDWGAFTETVTKDVGRRFRTLQQGADAVRELVERPPEPAAIRAAAIERYSLAAVRPLFNSWFEQLAGLWGPGWAA